MGKGGGSQKLQVTEYRMSVHAGVSLAGVDAIRRIFVDEKVAWEGNATSSGPITINKPNLFGGEKKEGGVGGTAYFLKGGPTQVLPDGLASRMGRLGANCPAYRHLTSVFFVGDVGTSSTGTDWSPDAGDYEEFDGDGLSNLRRSGSRYKGFYWGHNTPFIRPFWIEVEDFPRALDDVLGTDLAQIGNDANPAHIIYECLTDTEFGMGAPAASVNAAGSFASAAQTLYNESFGLSLEWSQQSEIQDFVQEVLDHIQAVCYPDPSTGKWELKLLRDDYDVGALETFDMSNANVTSFQRKAWGALADEMTVSWTNPDNEKKETLTLHNLASSQSRGTGSSATTRQFPGIRNAELATTVCARELRQASAPLAAVELEVENTGSAPLPGSVYRFDWPEYEEIGLVMRVMNVEEGRGSAKVRVSLMEDIFSLSKPTLPVQPGTGWESTSSDPEAVTTYSIFTLPYALTVPVLPAAGDDSLEYPEALAGVLAYQEDADVYQVDVLSQVVLPNGATVYQDTGGRDVGVLGALTETLSAEVESSVATPPGAEIGRTPVEGGYALIVGSSEETSEMCLVKANPLGGWLLQRGILDTTPKNWSAGTLVWYFDNADAVADVSRVRAGGESANYKFLARTSLGALDDADVSAVSATLTDRPHRPSRPANVKVDGTAFGPVTLAGKTEVVVTWSRRNRLTEDSVPLAWDDGDVVPEAGQTTVIRAVDSAGNLIKAWLDVPGTSITIPVSDFDSETAVLLQVFSARDDIASLQSANIWLLGSGVPEPSLPSGHDDLDIALPGTFAIVETGGNSNWNLCPDPNFQDASLWGFGAGPWFSVSRAGSTYPETLGAPKAAVLSSNVYSGDESQVLATPLLGGLFGDGKDLLFSARALNNGSGVADLTVEMTFHRSQDGAQVGPTQTLVWANGEDGYKEVKVTPPAGADARRFRVFNENGETWGADGAVADVQVIRWASPSTDAVGDTPADDILADIAELLTDVDVLFDELAEEITAREAEIEAERLQTSREIGELSQAIGAEVAALFALAHSESDRRLSEDARVEELIINVGARLDGDEFYSASSVDQTFLAIADFDNTMGLYDLSVHSDFAALIGDFDDLVDDVAALGVMVDDLPNVYLSQSDASSTYATQTGQASALAALQDVVEAQIDIVEGDLGDLGDVVDTINAQVSSTSTALATLTRSFGEATQNIAAQIAGALTAIAVSSAAVADVESAAFAHTESYRAEFTAQLDETIDGTLAHSIADVASYAVGQSDIDSSFAAWGLAVSSEYDITTRFGAAESDISDLVDDVSALDGELGTLTTSVANIVSDYITSTDQASAFAQFGLTLGAGFNIDTRFDDAEADIDTLTDDLVDANSAIDINAVAIAAADRAVAEMSQSIGAWLAGALASSESSTQAAVTQGEAVLRRLETLRVTLESDYLNSSAIEEAYLLQADFDSTVAAYTFSVNSVTRTIADHINHVEDGVDALGVDLDANYYTIAEANAEFMTSTEVNSAIASYDLSVHASITPITGDIDDILDDIDGVAGVSTGLNAIASLMLDGFVDNSDPDNPVLLARVVLEAAAGGGDPAYLSLTDGSGVNAAVLAAAQVVLANMGAGENEILPVLTAQEGFAFFSQPIHIDDDATSPTSRMIVGPDPDWFIWSGPPTEDADSATIANSDFALGTDGQAYFGGEAAGSLATRDTATQVFNGYSVTDRANAASSSIEMLALNATGLEEGSEVDIDINFGTGAVFGIATHIQMNAPASAYDHNIYLRVYRDKGGGNESVLYEALLSENHPPSVNFTRTQIVSLTVPKLTDTVPSGGGTIEYSLYVESERADTGVPSGCTIGWGNLHRGFRLLERQV